MDPEAGWGWGETIVATLQPKPAERGGGFEVAWWSGNGPGGLSRGVRRAMGRPHEAEGEKEEVVGLYQRLERGRSALFATFVAHWPGGDDDEELKRAARGARGP